MRRIRYTQLSSVKIWAKYDDVTTIEQLKMREQSAETQETLPWRLRIFEKFPNQPQMVALKRIPNEFEVPKIRESFMRHFLETDTIFTDEGGGGGNANAATAAAAGATTGVTMGRGDSTKGAHHHHHHHDRASISEIGAIEKMARLRGSVKTKLSNRA